MRADAFAVIQHDDLLDLTQLPSREYQVQQFQQSHLMGTCCLAKSKPHAGRTEEKTNPGSNPVGANDGEDSSNPHTITPPKSSTEHRSQKAPSRNQYADLSVIARPSQFIGGRSKKISQPSTGNTIGEGKKHKEDQVGNKEQGGNVIPSRRGQGHPQSNRPNQLVAIAGVEGHHLNRSESSICSYDLPFASHLPNDAPGGPDNPEEGAGILQNVLGSYFREKQTSNLCCC